MPSTVVLLSFLFLPALSEDLAKESCGRKVEPARGVSRVQLARRGPRARSPQHPQPSAQHRCSGCSGTSRAQAPGTAQGGFGSCQTAAGSEQGGGGVCPSVCPPRPVPAQRLQQPLTQPELLSPPQGPPDACTGLQLAKLRAQKPPGFPARLPSLPDPSHPLGSHPPAPQPPKPGTFPLDHLGADGEGVLGGAVGEAGSRPAAEGHAVILRGRAGLCGQTAGSGGLRGRSGPPPAPPGPFSAAN